MALYAISDLHTDYPENRAAVDGLAAFPEDWLIVAGDVGQSLGGILQTLEALAERFAQLIWVPGNHDLWTDSEQADLRGEARYQQLVRECRQRGILTPEDPFPLWRGRDVSYRIAPLFTLYDYSFHPPGVDEPLSWAKAAGILCADEARLSSSPYLDKPSWCRARCSYSERRLTEAPKEHPLVLVNHWPLVQELAWLPRIPEFSIWCGSTLSQSWHRQYPVAAAVFGHLHIAGTHYFDGIRFEEVSLGYPREWGGKRPLREKLRLIFP